MLAVHGLASPSLEGLAQRDRLCRSYQGSKSAESRKQGADTMKGHPKKSLEIENALCVTLNLSEQTVILRKMVQKNGE
jgi:hypothetical protein